MEKFKAKLLEERTKMSDVIPNSVYHMLEKEKEKAYKKFLEERFAEFGRHLAEMEQNNSKSQNSTQNDENERE